MANMPFRLGQWLVICDRCGFKRYSDQVIKTWDNFYVCAPSTGRTCWETRHPQEFLRASPEDMSVPFSRPRPADTFTSVDTVASTVGVQDTRIPSGTFDNSIDP